MVINGGVVSHVIKKHGQNGSHMIALGLYFLLVQIAFPYLFQLLRYKPTNIRQNLIHILVDPVLNYTVCAARSARVVTMLSMFYSNFIHLWVHLYNVKQSPQYKLDISGVRTLCHKRVEFCQRSILMSHTRRIITAVKNT